MPSNGHIDYKAFFRSHPEPKKGDYELTETKPADVRVSVFGRAVYLEFRNGGTTSQMIFTSECISPKTGLTVPTCFLSKLASKQHDTRPWTKRFARKTIGVQGVSANGNPSLRFEEVGDETALNMVGLVVEEFSSKLDAMYNGGWTLYRDPVIVEMSGDDVVKLEENATPAQLIRRVLQAREEAGFGKAIYEES